MLSKTTILTILTKFLILLANFALVVFSTRVWGSGGRGEIALVIANISIITILSNVICGSTIAFHSPRFQREFLLTVSFSGAVLISFAGALVLSWIFGFRYFMTLFIIALLMSFSTAVSSYWLGKNNINNYNLLNLLNSLFILGSLAVLYFLFHLTTLDTYFLAYIFGIGIVVIIGISGLLVKDPIKKPEISSAGLKSIFTYGINNEFNYFIQFLNYRLSYYFIAFLLGLGTLGIFSIVVSISEAVWIISQSMSAIHFSNVINSGDRLKDRHETIIFARQSFLTSSLLLGIAVLVPGSVYQLVFGIEFGDIRKFILYLAPGIIAIAVSNLYGHYFAGIGKLKILRNKSLIGLVASLVLLPLLIKKYQLTGACISLNVSYILSSLYLWSRFRRERYIEGTEA
jgi:O-antigen/teichoic acid export membrane protein